jgi:uncharacterized protein YbcI
MMHRVGKLIIMLRRIMQEKTQGQIEAEITRAIEKFEREYMGRGPEDARTFILGDLILIRLRGILTPAERQLSSNDNSKSRNLIKQLRKELIEGARPILESIILENTGASVVSLHTDISTKTGERVIIFTLNKKIMIEADR